MSAKPVRKPSTKLIFLMIVVGILCIAVASCVGVIWVVRSIPTPSVVPTTPVSLESAVPITPQNMDRLEPLYQFNVGLTVQSMQWSPDNTKLALLTRTFPSGMIPLGEPIADESLFLWDIRNGNGQRLISAKHSPVGGPRGISSYAFSPDGQILAFKVESAITLWDVIQNREQKTLDNIGSLEAESAIRPEMKQRNYPVSAISNMYTYRPSPDDKVLVVAYWDSEKHTIPKLKLYDGISGKELHPLAGSLNFAFSHDSRLIASQDRAQDLSQFAPMILSDLEGGQVLKRLEGEIDGNSMVFAPSDQLIAAYGSGGNTFVWVVNSGKRVTVRNGLNRVSVIGFSPDGRFLTIINNGLVQLWGVKP